MPGGVEVVSTDLSGHFLVYQKQSQQMVDSAVVEESLSLANGGHGRTMGSDCHTDSIEIEHENARKVAYHHRRCSASD